MKVLRIIARLNVGGPAKHVVWLTDGLASHGFETTLLAGSVPDGEASMEWFAKKMGVTPVYVREMSRELSFSDIRSFFRILTVILSEKPDIIHTHTAKAGTLGRFAGALYRFVTRRKVRLVHTYHGHVFHGYYSRWKTFLFISIERFLARFATDKFIAISELQKREIVETFKVGRPKQCVVIKLGLDLEELRRATVPTISKDELFPSEEGIFLVGFVGRLTEIKNIGLALEAMRKLKDARREGIKLVLIGEGNLRKFLEDRVASLEIGDRVRFAGNLPDPAGFLPQLDLVILTSLNEGTPLSLLESMAVGRPVLATEVGGVPDILGSVSREVDGISIRERGLTVKSGDSEAFANAISLLADDADLRIETSSSALRFIEDAYSKDRLIRDIAELYNRF